MIRVAQLTFIALMLMSSPVVLAGPAEDANAAVDRWSSAYSTNDPENIAKTYWPDAMLLGTVSPVMSEGTQCDHRDNRRRRTYADARPDRHALARDADPGKSRPGDRR